MDNPQIEAEKYYISQWKENALQHYIDGDYGWLCDFIKENARYCHGIAEIGCGAGYSTLSFLERGLKVLSFDINQEAIDVTQKLLREKGFTDVPILNADAIHQVEQISDTIIQHSESIELIILCNPGGNLSSSITKGEYNILSCFGFTEDEVIANYNERGIHLLHKWAMIYAACVIATLCQKAILIVERATKQELIELFDQISKDVGNRCICSAYHPINDAPKNGVKLSASGGKCHWGAAIFYPQ